MVGIGFSIIFFVGSAAAASASSCEVEVADDSTKADAQVQQVSLLQKGLQVLKRANIERSVQEQTNGAVDNAARHAIASNSMLTEAKADAASKNLSRPPIVLTSTHRQDFRALKISEMHAAMEPYFGEPELEYQLLQRSYSTTLYGAEDRVDLEHIDIIWPEILGANSTLLLKKPLCGHHEIVTGTDAQKRLLYLGWQRPYRMFSQARAIWVRYPDIPSRDKRVSVVKDHDWIEVVHCAYNVECKGKCPMWFFAAKGSGVSLNVGRTIVVQSEFTRSPYLQEDGISIFVNGKVRSAKIPGTQRLAHVADGNYSALAKVLKTHFQLDISDFDSIQFPKYAGFPFGTWKADRKTEIKMLHMYNESDSIEPHLNNKVACGRYPYLRSCGKNDVVVQQQLGCRTPLRAKAILEVACAKV